MALPDDFKNTLSCWPSGVTVVTTEREGLLYGLTVSSFTSVSLAPPLVLVCLASDRITEAVRAVGRFAVSILALGQEEASAYFATPQLKPTNGFVQVPGSWTAGGLPVVADAAGYVECEVHEMRPLGDHELVVGRVVNAVCNPGKEPLVYHRRGYHGIT